MKIRFCALMFGFFFISHQIALSFPGIHRSSVKPFIFRELVMGGSLSSFPEGSGGMFENPAYLAGYGKVPIDPVKVKTDPLAKIPSYAGMRFDLLNVSVGLPVQFITYSEPLSVLISAGDMGDVSNWIETRDMFKNMGIDLFSIIGLNIDDKTTSTSDDEEFDAYTNVIYSMFGEYLSFTAGGIMPYFQGLTSSGGGIFWIIDSHFKPDFSNLLSALFKFDVGVYFNYASYLKDYGFKAGVLFKIFTRVAVEADDIDELTQLAELSDTPELEAFQSDVEDASESGNPLEMVNAFLGARYPDNEVIFIGKGISFDFGLIMGDLKKGQVSLVVNDFPSLVVWGDGGVSFISPNVRVGYSQILFEGWKPWLYNFTGTVEVDDLLFTQQYSLFAKLHFGTSVSALFDTLKFYVGLNRGFPTGGIAVDLSIDNFLRTDYGTGTLWYLTYIIRYLHISAEMGFFARELGDIPGNAPAYQVSSGVRLGWYRRF